MPNIAQLLKSEIARVARKELRTQVAALKKLAQQHRTEIAALKRRTAELEVQVRRAAAPGARRAAAPEPENGDVHSALRFSARGLASQRRRLGLSAADVGLLVGASGQSVYLWESGKSRPRARLMPAIAELRRMGKRQANARLADLRAAA